MESWCDVIDPITGMFQGLIMTSNFAPNELAFDSGWNNQSNPIPPLSMNQTSSGMAPPSGISTGGSNGGGSGGNYGAAAAAAANAPKYGTLVPNRVFVGGLPAGTTEMEMSTLFACFGVIKAVKIISDRAGVSKGYGFVTFESDSEAQRLLREGDNIILKDRKLNIAPAIKKQPFSRSFEVLTGVSSQQHHGSSGSSMQHHHHHHHAQQVPLTPQSPPSAINNGDSDASSSSSGVSGRLMGSSTTPPTVGSGGSSSSSPPALVYSTSYAAYNPVMASANGVYYTSAPPPGQDPTQAMYINPHQMSAPPPATSTMAQAHHHHQVLGQQQQIGVVTQSSPGGPFSVVYPQAVILPAGYQLQPAPCANPMPSVWLQASGAQPTQLTMLPAGIPAPGYPSQNGEYYGEYMYGPPTSSSTATTTTTDATQYMAMVQQQQQGQTQYYDMAMMSQQPPVVSNMGMQGYVDGEIYGGEVEPEAILPPEADRAPSETAVAPENGINPPQKKLAEQVSANPITKKRNGNKTSKYSRRRKAPAASGAGDEVVNQEIPGEQAVKEGGGAGDAESLSRRLLKGPEA